MVKLETEETDRRDEKEKKREESKEADKGIFALSWSSVCSAIDSDFYVGTIFFAENNYAFR